MLDLFGVWIFFDEDVLWFEISMHNTTYLHVVNCLYELKHSKRYFIFFKLVCFNMIKQFSARYLFHDDIHITFCFIRLFHLHYVRMWNQFDNLNFFTEEVFFSVAELFFNDMLCCYYFLSITVLALIHCWELTFAKLWSSDKLFIETHVATFNTEKSHPIFNYFLVLMIVCPRLNQLTFIWDGKSVSLCFAILNDLIDEHSFEENNQRWNRLFLIVINEECLITQDIISVSHRSCSFTYF